MGYFRAQGTVGGCTSYISPPTSASPRETNKRKKKQLCIRKAAAAAAASRQPKEASSRGGHIRPSERFPGIVGSGNGGDSAGNWSLGQERKQKMLQGPSKLRAALIVAESTQPGIRILQI